MPKHSDTVSSSWSDACSSAAAAVKGRGVAVSWSGSGVIRHDGGTSSLGVLLAPLWIGGHGGEQLGFSERVLRGISAVSTSVYSNPMS